MKHVSQPVHPADKGSQPGIRDNPVPGNQPDLPGQPVYGSRSVRARFSRGLLMALVLILLLTAGGGLFWLSNSGLKTPAPASIPAAATGGVLLVLPAASEYPPVPALWLQHALPAAGWTVRTLNLAGTVSEKEQKQRLSDGLAALAAETGLPFNRLWLVAVNQAAGSLLRTGRQLDMAGLLLLHAPGYTRGENSLRQAARLWPADRPVALLTWYNETTSRPDPSQAAGAAGTGLADVSLGRRAWNWDLSAPRGIFAPAESGVTERAVPDSTEPAASGMTGRVAPESSSSLFLTLYEYLSGEDPRLFAPAHQMGGMNTSSWLSADGRVLLLIEPATWPSVLTTFSPGLADTLGTVLVGWALSGSTDTAGGTAETTGGMLIPVVRQAWRIWLSQHWLIAWLALGALLMVPLLINLLPGQPWSKMPGQTPGQMPVRTLADPSATAGMQPVYPQSLQSADSPPGRKSRIMTARDWLLWLPAALLAGGLTGLLTLTGLLPASAYLPPLRFFWLAIWGCYGWLRLAAFWWPKWQHASPNGLSGRVKLNISANSRKAIDKKDQSTDKHNEQLDAISDEISDGKPDEMKNGESGDHNSEKTGQKHRTPAQVLLPARRIWQLLLALDLLLLILWCYLIWPPENWLSLVWPWPVATWLLLLLHGSWFFILADFAPLVRPSAQPSGQEASRLAEHSSVPASPVSARQDQAARPDRSTRGLVSGGVLPASGQARWPARPGRPGQPGSFGAALLNGLVRLLPFWLLGIMVMIWSGPATGLSLALAGLWLIWLMTLARSICRLGWPFWTGVVLMGLLANGGLLILF